MGGVHDFGFTQRRDAPLIPLSPTWQHGWHHDPPLLLQNGLGLLVSVSFVAVVAVLARCHLAHFVAKMPGLDNVAVAKPHRLATLAAGVGLTVLIGVVGVDNIMLRILSKSEARKAGHKRSRNARHRYFSAAGTFIPMAI